MTFNYLCSFISKLMKEKFTGRLIIDFHKGAISHKLKREITEILEEEK